SGAGTGTNKANRRQYGIMVASQIALALAILSGTAIVVRSEIRLEDYDPGYDVKGVTRAWLLLRVDHDTALSSAGFLNNVLSRVRALPDVADASVELSHSLFNSTITVYDAGNAPQEVPAPLWGYTIATSSTLRTLRRPVVRGRDFVDGTPGAPELIIDEETAQLLWPNADPIGKQLKLGDSKSNEPWVRVVGVVGVGRGRRRNMNLGVDGWLGADAPPDTGQPRKGLGQIFYAPGVQDSIRVGKLGFVFSIAVRSKSDPDRMPIILRRGLLHASPLRLRGVRFMEDQIRGRRQNLSFVVSIFSLFAAVAVGLAALGTYGIVAHSVAERKRELGVRIALGATGRDILAAVLREGNALVLAGIALGLLLTKLTAHWLQAFAFENDLYDAPMFAVVAILLFGVAVLAAVVPALRATRINPVESLRSE
ncbi:MAG TPA: FtsX-like permease family protein, partial [Gemmatimonadaceae bacterium]|nr:FtsX-like permease family protein [Gemmatimonadaceae bacterium]